MATGFLPLNDPSVFSPVPEGNIHTRKPFFIAPLANSSLSERPLALGSKLDTTVPIGNEYLLIAFKSLKLTSVGYKQADISNYNTPYFIKLSVTAGT